MEKEGRGRTLRDLLVGVLIGVAAMLPGISGAVMAVAFGIYERLVRDIADLRVYLRKDAGFLLVLVIGVAVGTVASAKLLNVVLEEYPVPSQFLFAGLILGQMPAVYRMCGRTRGEKLRAADWAALAVGLAVMGSMIVADVMGQAEDISVAHDAAGFALMFAIGLIVAISALVPGISHSTILIVFGAMAVFTEAVGNLEMFLLIPLALGVVAGALGFSKVVHYALENHHRATSFLILGLTVGSLASLTYATAADAASALDVAAGIAAFIAGTLASLWFVRMGDAYGDARNRERAIRASGTCAVGDRAGADARNGDGRDRARVKMWDRMEARAPRTGRGYGWGCPSGPLRLTILPAYIRRKGGDGRK